MKSIFALGVLVLLQVSFARADQPAVYLDPSAPVEQRVEDLLGRMTLEEKISILHADSKFTTAAIPRLGIPRRWLSDGPHGVREDIGPDTWKPAGRTDDFSTGLPNGLGLAATWNPEMARAYGQVIGQEARKRGKAIMLGPSLNIQRTPLCGRNFEYMGEDPFLTSRMAVGYIQGAQKEGISSCAKHFALNNQEVDRNTIDVHVDERPLREIYLPAFRAAVEEGGVLSVMGAYNQVRGEHCCENTYLLRTILKGEWGFKGLVVSDWNAAHDTVPSALAGLDLEMGTEKKASYDDYYFAQPLLEAVRNGQVPMPVLDDMVRRNLRVMILTHLLDPPAPAGALNTPEHQAAARKVAEEAMVLLKNDGDALPLDDHKLTSIAVIGENAVTKLVHGGGSSEIKSLYEVTPLEGIVRRAGRNVNVTFSMGYGAKPDAEWVDRAVKAASQSDVAIIVAGLNHADHFDSEGSDRLNLQLPYGQDDLIERVAAANPRTIVVLVSGGAVEMPWLKHVPAVLQAWYGGMEGGTALAKILFGDTNPSGKLPCTFPKQLMDSPAHAMGNYPGKDGVVTYAEGLLVGYRWFDTKEIEPLFCFGYGLSYTKFDYSNLRLSSDGEKVVAQCDITNTGARAGAVVCELYVHEDHPSMDRPEKELKGFSKIFLQPGEKQTVTIPLDRGAFSYYDPGRKAWVADKGDFEILVGSSSRDIRLKGKWTRDSMDVAANN